MDIARSAGNSTLPGTPTTPGDGVHWKPDFGIGAPGVRIGSAIGAGVFGLLSIPVTKALHLTKLDRVGFVLVAAAAGAVLGGVGGYELLGRPRGTGGDVPSLPAPTHGAATGHVLLGDHSPTGRPLNFDRRATIAAVDRDPHPSASILETLIPSPGHDDGVDFRVGVDGFTDRDPAPETYATLADAMGAAERSDGLQAVYEQDGVGFFVRTTKLDRAIAAANEPVNGAATDVRGLIVTTDAEGIDSERIVDGRPVDTGVHAVALEYGKAWLAPADTGERAEDEVGKRAIKQWVLAKTEG